MAQRWFSGICMTHSPPTATRAPHPVHVNAPHLQVFVFALFFIFGGITSLNDVLIPKFKGLFTLQYRESMLVQSAYFFAYFVISLPAAEVVRRIGYLRTAVLGLLIMTAGCLLFIPAASAGVFGMFLIALFVLASGVTIVQVVANPLISLLGPLPTAHSRLTFAQAFNSLGTTIFPYFGSIVILGALASVDPARLSGAALMRFRQEATGAIEHAYIALAAVLAALAVLVWLNRSRLNEAHDHSPGMLHALQLLRLPRFAFGALCIFLYVGAEVSIGSLIVNYLSSHDVLGIDELSAGKRVPLYWGGAMVGRFIGAGLLRVIRPGVLLAVFAAVAIALLTIAANATGVWSGYALLSIGLFNSIMFPTIFSLASEGLGKRASDGSGVICLAIVGGAVVPFITGQIADLAHSLRIALIAPAVCYAIIVCYGISARNPVRSVAADA